MEIKTSINSQDFMKRAFYLAYNASSVMGLGVLQQRDDVSEKDIWININGRGDYPTNLNGGMTYGDYVFGRMMKWGGRIEDEKTINITQDLDYKFNIEYQSFARKYPTNKALLDATAKDLNCTYSVEVEKPTA